MARVRRRYLLVPSLAALAMGAAAYSAAPAAEIGGDPAAAQIARAHDLYSSGCSACHAVDLSGNQFGPPLKGSVFAGRWQGQPAGALARYIAEMMPPSAPRTLAAPDAAALEAYIARGGGVNLAAAPPAAAPAAQGAPTPPPAGPRDPALEQVRAARLAPLARLTPVTEALLRRPPESSWLMWRRTYQTLGFSPLKQIDKASVGRLANAWSWALAPSQNEITPIIHDGVLFIQSGDTVQALNAVNGDLLWQYVHPLAPNGPEARTTRVKTMAIYQDRVFAAFVDGHVSALDVKTGKLVWDREILTDAEVNNRGKADGDTFHIDGGPIIAKGKVVFGVSLGTNTAKGGCFIIALDAGDGREVWRFNTIAQPGQPGGDTWNGAPALERFGGGVWTPGSYDPDLNLLYFGVGNTYTSATLLEPRNGQVGKNDGLYTGATVALDADTGKLAWHFQHVRREVWDLDWVFEQSLVDLNIGGKPRKLVVTGGKIALFDAVDRATGQFVFAHDMGLQNLVLGVDPKTGEKRLNPALEPVSGKANFMCPGPIGHRNWPSTAIDPSGVMYVPMLEFCTEHTYAPKSPAETALGGVDMRFSGMVRPPGADDTVSRLAAIDLKTGKPVWTRHERAPLASAILSTAGGLVFAGDRDRYFRAFDSATGKTLWETRLNAAPSSFPVTYTVGGEQYVAVTSGGGNSWDGATASAAGEIVNPAGGTTLWVFKLPARR